MERIEHPHCMRCGELLEEVKKEDYINFPYDEEEGVGAIAEYRCPHCLTYYSVFPPDEEVKESYPAYNKEAEETFVDAHHGYDGECPLCGNHIVWSGDFMRSEVWGDTEQLDSDGNPIVDEYGTDVDDALASYVRCPYCGADIEIVEAKPSELKALEEKK